MLWLLHYTYPYNEPFTLWQFWKLHKTYNKCFFKLLTLINRKFHTKTKQGPISRKYYINPNYFLPFHSQNVCKTCNTICTGILQDKWIWTNIIFSLSVFNRSTKLKNEHASNLDIVRIQISTSCQKTKRIFDYTMFELYLLIRNSNTRDILPKNLKKCFGGLKNVWLSRIFYYAVSEWLLFNAKLTIFSYILARGSYIWWDDVRFVLDQHALLDFNCASSLKQQSTDRHVAPLGHIILIPRQPILALSLLCCMLRGEVTNTVPI